MEQNLNLYHIFYQVARCKNISGAARELYISQPAISKAISKLEQNLNTSLFIRSSRGVKLTETGEVLYHQLETAFCAITQGEEQLLRMQKLGMGHITIGASATLCKYVLLPILQKFIKQNPHIEISISCQSTYETMAALENGSIDVGLIGANEQMDKFSFYPALEIQDIFVTTQTYLDHLKERLMLDKLSAKNVFTESTLILLNKENITRQYVDQYLSYENLEPSQVIEVSSLDLIIEFAKIDLGIACVIKDFVKDELASGRLLQLKTPVSIPKRAVGFALLKNSIRSESVQKFLSFCEASEGQIP